MTGSSTSDAHATRDTRGRLGLYGSAIGQRAGRAALAELVGTAVLVYTGTAAAVADTAQAGGTYDLLAIVLAFGVALTALVAALGHVSGCHLNPAITIGLAVTRRFPWPATATYVAAQLAGGVVGALATWVSFGDRARTAASLGATVPAAGVSQGRAFVVEALVTFVLVLVVVSVATDRRALAPAAPLAVGAALSAAIFIAGPLTGGAVNPARAFGPDLLSGHFSPLWLYLVAPTLGGTLAAVLYDRVLATAEPPTD